MSVVTLAVREIADCINFRDNFSQRVPMVLNALSAMTVFQRGHKESKTVMPSQVNGTGLLVACYACDQLPSSERTFLHDRKLARVSRHIFLSFMPLTGYKEKYSWLTRLPVDWVSIVCS